MTLTRATDLPHDIAPLVEASEDEGFAFVRRLVEEWRSGANRFDRDGEALLVARVADELAGVCGVNVDPYTREAGVARLRHLYVLPAARRQGIGRALVEAAVRFASGYGYTTIRLSTDTAPAAEFYERLGFRRTSPGERSTHRLALHRQQG